MDLGSTKQGIATAATRAFLLLGLFATASDSVVRANAAGQRQLDRTGHRQTFAAEFNDPATPLSIKQGGPFTLKFEEWGALRTLPGNKEQQLYVEPGWIPNPKGTDDRGRNDAPPGSGGAPVDYNPFRVADGLLSITAIPAPPAVRQRIDRSYLSGMLSTEWSFAQRYGYFEARAKLPAGRGLWPAVWMVGKTHAEHVELDILEALGHSVTTAYQGGQPQPVSDYSKDFHTYGMEWTPEAVTFFIDGRQTMTVSGERTRGKPPMYLILNLAVGGSWGGNPDAATRFPATMQVDWLRAWQLPCTAFRDPKDRPEECR